ncbi:DUF4935 domain-containing protein [Saccharophagus degradans]|uniref:PIN domain-containing protein n=1 Tax=Saccharophagus degradans TaxID=86304 RepID=UPI001C0A0EEC|nr:DUF4935 domain-containing protein [Saccharophagus degradans]
MLFIDTCSILDIINSLHMNSLSEKYAISALELSKLHGSDIWLTTSQNVREEWSDNIDSVIATMEREALKVDRNVSSMLTVSNTLLNASYFLPQKISSLNISAHIRSLSEAFLDTCLSLERKDDHTLRAMQRVRKNEAPARKGKPEPKDCEIVECFLELGHKLRAYGFSQKLIFFTANKDDFGTNRELKQPLDNQFSTINAELINNIDHVLAIAKGQA